MQRGIALLTLCCSTVLFTACKQGYEARWTQDPPSPCLSTKLENMTGYFVSKDGFYGSPDRVEYLDVKLDGGFLVATKLVGDRNVPRGMISWITLSPHECASDQSLLSIKIQARMNADDPKGFFWMDETANHVRALDRNTLVVGFKCGQDCYEEGTLSRVTEKQAIKAKNSIKDHE